MKKLFVTLLCKLFIKIFSWYCWLEWWSKWNRNLVNLALIFSEWNLLLFLKELPNQNHQTKDELESLLYHQHFLIFVLDLSINTRKIWEFHFYEKYLSDKIFSFFRSRNLFREMNLIFLNWFVHEIVICTVKWWNSIHHFISTKEN